MSVVFALAIVTAVICQTIQAYDCPADCHFQLSGSLETAPEEGQKYANDASGEPAPDPENGIGGSTCHVTGSDAQPTAESFDEYAGLTGASEANGHGVACYEAEVWTTIHIVGKWSFAHYVQQTWWEVGADTHIYKSAPPAKVATASASAWIKDDLSGNEKNKTASASGAGGNQCHSNFLLKTDQTVSTVGPMNDDLLFCGRTRAYAQDTWRGATHAMARASSNGDLTLVINNPQHIAQ